MKYILFWSFIIISLMLFTFIVCLGFVLISVWHLDFKRAVRWSGQKLDDVVELFTIAFVE